MLASSFYHQAKFIMDRWIAPVQFIGLSSYQVSTGSCLSCSARAHRHAAQAYPTHERHNHKATTRTAARPHGAPSLFLCLRGRGDRTESNSGRRRVPTCRWRCSQLLPHCPPDTSRTGLLGRCRLLSPRRHARTPTAGAGPSDRLSALDVF